MPRAWGPTPRNDLGKDLQALALWIFIIGVVGYILFPNVFKEIYSHLSDPVTQTSTLKENYSLDNSTNLTTNTGDPQTLLGEQDLLNVSDSLMNGHNEVSSGYWAIFVAQGEFKQLALNNDAYAFLLRLIQGDQKADGNNNSNTVILTANGQIQKFTVSREVYSIIMNMASILGRTTK